MLEAGTGSDPDQASQRIDWTIDALPILVADQNMMRQLWQNLIGNAMKYSNRRPVASIHVGYEREPDGSHHFSVRDNGAGFDMAYADKLFGVFQRLHKESDYAGTGIGLASVRRVLSRHGGRIWAEALVDQGATFHFILPGALDAPFTQESIQ
jgi:light-regulated signal transduction histidine kinase (bacteriophytochrome)